MRALHDPIRRSDLPVSPVVSIGNFDGVHLGHREILEETVRRAAVLGVPASVITFDPHPLRILMPERAPKMLLTLGQKEEQFASLGIDDLLVIPFTRDFSLTAAPDFIRAFLVEALHVREVVIGRGFYFGHARSGDLALLTSLGKEFGFLAHGVPDVSWKGAPISSTRIRRALAAGSVADANSMLGRPFSIEGFVARGARVGRSLGFPTLNIHPEGELWPGDGVYVTRTELRSSFQTFDSVTNVGTRPTLYENSATSVESFVLDFSQDVYGEEVRLYFLERIRDERKFDSVEELAEQISLDVEFARGWFRRNPCGPGGSLAQSEPDGEREAR